jgi:hypothetical protein
MTLIWQPYLMPSQPVIPPAQEDQSFKIRILQINLNKLEKAHLNIINEKVSQNYNIMLIQEPYTTKFNAIRTPANFRPVIPKNREEVDVQIRLVIWVNKHLETKDTRRPRHERHHGDSTQRNLRQSHDIQCLQRLHAR